MKTENTCPCPVVELDLLFQGCIFRSGSRTCARAHTHIFPLHTFVIKCLWLTQPLERTTSQHVALSQLVRMFPQHMAVFCSYYTDPSFWNRMHVLQLSRFVGRSVSSNFMWKWHKMSLQKRHMEVLSCEPIKQTFSVSVEETSRAAGPVLRVNLLPPPGFKPPSLIPSADFSSSVRFKRTTNHFSHHPINYWLLVCIITFLQQSWNEWQGTLPIARGQYLLHSCQFPHLATAPSRKTRFGHNTCTKLEKKHKRMKTITTQAVQSSTHTTSHHQQFSCKNNTSNQNLIIHKTKISLCLRINLKLTCTGRNILY